MRRFLSIGIPGAFFLGILSFFAWEMAGGKGLFFMVPIAIVIVLFSLEYFGMFTLPAPVRTILRYAGVGAAIAIFGIWLYPKAVAVFRSEASASSAGRGDVPFVPGKRIPVGQEWKEIQMPLKEYEGRFDATDSRIRFQREDGREFTQDPGEDPVPVDGKPVYFGKEAKKKGLGDKIPGTSVKVRKEHPGETEVVLSTWARPPAPKNPRMKKSS